MLVFMLFNVQNVSFSDDNDVQNVLVDLYGLMHARYILSFNGLEMMKNKYLRGIFGKCPRDLCDGQNCLPTGLYLFL